jgi:glycosyltransferase involved in cell wall biosynthesis
MRDVIDDNVTGLLFPQGDYGALEKALVCFIEDPNLRTRVGARARDTVLQRHTWVKNARLVVQLTAGGNSAKRFVQMKQLDCDTP